MHECPACGNITKSWEQKCPKCNFVVGYIDGFLAWAPEISKLSAGHFFEPEKFKELAALEDASFWFQARNQLILWALKQYFGKPNRFAEIGCGTGYVLRAVEQAFPEAQIFGTELFIEGLKFASQRCSRAELVQLDARQIPYRDQFDIVGIFDVLEHIEEDTTVLAQIHKSLVANGGLLITVPQHQWLWSPLDRAASHVRRYSANELESKVTTAGFKILRSTSFVSFLLPGMCMKRLSLRKPVDEVTTALTINRISNWFCIKIMSIESFLIHHGVDFPLGGSRLLIAKKIT
jgi:SAM-dependent methyltransferase